MSQANPRLRWHEVQDILITSAEVIHPNDTTWQTNGAGLKYHHQYGYLLSAILIHIKIENNYSDVILNNHQYEENIFICLFSDLGY